METRVKSFALWLAHKGGYFEDHDGDAHTHQTNELAAQLEALILQQKPVDIGVEEYSFKFKNAGGDGDGELIDEELLINEIDEFDDQCCDFVICLSPSNYLLESKSLTDELVIRLGQEKLISGYRRISNNRRDSVDILLKLNPTTDFLFREADRVNMYKRLANGGCLSEFNLREAEVFENALAVVEGSNVKNRDFFTDSERIILINAFLSSILVTNALPAKKGKPLLAVLKKLDVVKCAFPPHDQEKKKQLADEWIKGKGKGLSLDITDQPLDSIRSYLGGTVAIYSAWLQHYTRLLVIPSFIGLFLFYQQQKEGEVDSTYVPFYSVFICVWAVLFLESWRRRENALSHVWGSRKELEVELERPEFQGETLVSEITGLPERVYPDSYRYAKQFCSWFTVACVLGALLWVMIRIMRWDREISMSDPPRHWIVSLLPNIIDAIVVEVSNRVFVKLATLLNQWENYKTEQRYENALILKLVVFYALNTYTPLFFLAFYECRLESLKEQLFSLLLIHQVLDNFQEAALPTLKRNAILYIESWLENASEELKMKTKTKTKTETKSRAKLEKKKKSKIEMEMEMDDYNDTFEDFLEIVIQFGHVTMFAMALPIASILALFNNVIELRSDAYKILQCSKRPVPKISGGIGSWFQVLQAFAVVAVIANTALLLIATDTLEIWLTSFSDYERIAFALAIEHLCLFVLLFLGYVIPDRPKWVRIEQAKEDHKARSLLEEARRRIPTPPPPHQKQLSRQEC